MPGAENLTVRIEAKHFGRRQILDTIRFEARPGEHIAVLAPSGTGKTTMLRIILGLDTDFAGGIIRLPGRVGAVFQEPRLLPWLDVAGNLRLVAPALDDGAVKSLLGIAGLPDIARLMPKALSLGMARRVALARALAVAPSLLILDEPFASLDPRLAFDLAAQVTAHARSIHATVLVATHDLDQALVACDRLLILGVVHENHVTLAADILCPDHADADARRALAKDVRQRFAFLSREAA